MPLWPDLTENLAEQANIPTTNGGPAVASEFERQYGRVSLIDAIRDALHQDTAEPGRAHRAFANLPFDVIYTTNFDLLLEAAYTSARRPYRSLVGELQMPFAGGQPAVNIVKMHGDLRHEEHIVVTTEDYAEFLQKYAVIATHLAGLLITRTALFIGYSLSDPDFQNIRRAIQSRLGKFQRKAYVLAVGGTSPTPPTSDDLHVVPVAAVNGQEDTTLAGVFDSILRTMDARSGVRLREARPDAFEAVKQTKGRVARVGEQIGSPEVLGSSSTLCFVLMPFGPQFESVYHLLIRPAIEAQSLTALRADEMMSMGSITEQIRVAIQQSRLCIADLTAQNANVLYEVGIAHTHKKPTVLITQSIDDVPFDLRELRVISYEMTGLEKARQNLERAISHVLGEDQMERAERLIAQGEYRAAIAALSVQLEQGLRRLAVSKLPDPSLTQRSQRLGISRLAKLLTDADVITETDARELRHLGSLRSKAIHETAEPSEEDARMMRDFVETFTRKRFRRA